MTTFSTAQDTLVEQLLDMTQAIEHAALMADWPEAARLLEARTPLLHSLEARQSPRALKMIQRVRALDVALAQNAREVQAELADEYHAAMRRIHATKQYHRAALL